MVPLLWSKDSRRRVGLLPVFLIMNLFNGLLILPLGREVDSSGDLGGCMLISLDARLSRSLSRFYNLYELIPDMLSDA